MSKHVKIVLFPVTQVTQRIAFPNPFAQRSYTSSPPMMQPRQFSLFPSSLQLSTTLSLSSIQFNQIKIQLKEYFKTTVQELF